LTFNKIIKKIKYRNKNPLINKTVFSFRTDSAYLKFS